MTTESRDDQGVDRLRVSRRSYEVPAAKAFSLSPTNASREANLSEGLSLGWCVRFRAIAGDARINGMRADTAAGGGTMSTPRV